jgi:prepilin-type N-terminal cleavage/methylation domain-containing protein
MNRRGLTLVELMVGLVVAAIVGGSLVRLIMGELRSVETQEAWRTSRAVARSGVNRLTSDLRMVEATGLEAAATGGQDFTVRVPYAFGVACTTTGSATTVSLLPTDSAMYAAAGFSGFAWRDATTGAYTYVTSAATLASGAASNCTGAGITTLTGGRVVQLGGTVPSALPAGTVVFLFRRVRYEFKASTMISGRTGLWRTTLSGGASEELAAPFDNTARVRFYVLNGTAAQDAVPSPLSDVRGLELQLDGMSEITPRGATSPKKMTLKTSVFFQTRAD